MDLDVLREFRMILVFNVLVRTTSARRNQNIILDRFKQRDKLMTTKNNTLGVRFRTNLLNMRFNRFIPLVSGFQLIIRRVSLSFIIHNIKATNTSTHRRNRHTSDNSTFHRVLRKISFPPYSLPSSRVAYRNRVQSLSYLVRSSHNLVLTSNRHLYQANPELVMSGQFTAIGIKKFVHINMFFITMLQRISELYQCG